jgi:hypothetical protein
MKPKSLITIALLLFVVASVVAFVIKNTSDAGAGAAVDPVITGTEGKVVVYYFHRTQRCPTCNKIEELAAGVVKSKFAGALESGKLVWSVVNIEEPGNAHFETDYSLITQSLIVADFRDPKNNHWKNLDQIWELVWTEPEFNEYVATEIASFVGDI